MEKKAIEKQGQRESDNGQEMPGTSRPDEAIQSGAMGPEGQARMERAIPEPMEKTVQEGLQRQGIEDQPTTDGGKSMTLSLQDTILDERNDVMGVINELEDQLDRQQEIRERLEAELRAANDKLQAAGQRNQELEWQVVTLQTRIEALEQMQQELRLLEEELATANGQIQRLNEEFQRVDKERSRLKAELKAANKQLEELWALKKERDGLKADLKNLTARLEEQDRTQRELMEERGDLITRLQETAAALDEARADRHQQQILLRAAEDRSRELARIQEELADKVEAIRAEKKHLQAQIAQLERENARLIEQRHYYETELTSMRNATRNAEAALASVKKAFAEVRVALTETKARARRRMIETWPRIGVPMREAEGGRMSDMPRMADDMLEPADITPKNVGMMEPTTVKDGQSEP